MGRGVKGGEGPWKERRGRGRRRGIDGREGGGEGCY